MRFIQGYKDSSILNDQHGISIEEMIFFKSISTNAETVLTEFNTHYDKNFQNSA